MILHTNFEKNQKTLKNQPKLKESCNTANFKINSLRLLTNNPLKINGLEKHGVKILERVPLTVKSTKHNVAQLNAKREKMGHMYPAA